MTVDREHKRFLILKYFTRYVMFRYKTMGTTR